MPAAGTCIVPGSQPNRKRSRWTNHAQTTEVNVRPGLLLGKRRSRQLVKRQPGHLDESANRISDVRRGWVLISDHASPEAWRARRTGRRTHYGRGARNFFAAGGRGLRTYRRACPAANGLNRLSRGAWNRWMAFPIYPASMRGSLKIRWPASSASQAPPGVMGSIRKVLRRHPATSGCRKALTASGSSVPT